MNDFELIRQTIVDSDTSNLELITALNNIEKKLDLLNKLEETLYNTDLYLVYKHTSPTNKVYIGITKNLPNARWNEGAGYETQKKFYKAIQMYGWINFKHEIIAAGLSEEEARYLEGSLILEYKSNDSRFGYNTQVTPVVVDTPTLIDKKINKKNISTLIDEKSIAKDVIEKFNLKTINGTIYYLHGGNYIKEKEHPVINKELLLEYEIDPRKHKNIIDIIKILSCVNKEDVLFGKEDVSSEPEILTLNNELEDKPQYLLTFIKQFKIEEYDFFISDVDLYNLYTSWAINQKADIISLNQFSRDIITLIEKYRVDLQYVNSPKESGWKMLSIVFDGIRSSILTSYGKKKIVDWLNETNEQMICVSMICEFALGYTGEKSKKLSNEICSILRGVENKWKQIGSARCGKYGVQRCFIRK